MFYPHLFTKATFNPELALQYGFVLKDNIYELCRPLNIGDFEAVVYLTSKTCEVRVVEGVEKEEYVLFNVPSSQGTFVSQMRAEVGELLKEIVQKCFVQGNIKERLLEYVFKKYNTLPEAPWDDKENQTLKAPSQKWYGIFMNIKPQSLGLEGKEKIDVMNVKLDPAYVESLIDNQHYFKAYHMNKKYWMTILLDSSVDVEFVKSLIDKSYNLVC